MNIYDTANKLAKEIKESKEYKEYRKLKLHIEENPEQKEKVEDFEHLRYKLGGRCRFELYNPSILKNANSSANFYNFIGFSETAARDILDGKEPPMDKTYTKGNYIRGVL